MAEKTKQKITKDMPFGKVLQKYPETARVLMDKGMHCLGCMAATFESIEQGAVAHGLDADELVAEMNKAIETKAKKK